MPGKANPTRDDGRAALASADRDAELEQIRKSCQGIRFGEVRLIIQDGVVVQIERIEKQRLR